MGTLLDHRRALLRAVPELGRTYTLTALATGSITIGSLANSNFPTNLYRNAIAWRGEATTAADNLRYLGLLTASSGLIAHTGAVYSDTTVTNEEVEIWYDPEMRPDTDINPLMEEALGQLRALCRIPLAHGPIDFDMQASGITNWTANSGTPFAKQTTAAQVLRGRSGVLTDAGSGGDYTDSALYPIHGGNSGNMYFIAKADTGTGKFITLDGSGNIQASVSITSEDWVLGWKRVDFDSTDELWRLRAQAVAASDSVDIDSFWFVKEHDYYFDLSRTPGWITSLDHVVGVSVARPRVQAETDTYQFGSVEYEELREGEDFYFQRQHADANPTGVFILKQKYMTEPLFLNVSCPWTSPYGVARAYTAETDSTECMRDLHLAQCKILLAERYGGKKWAQVVGEQGRKEKLALISQVAQKPAEPRRSGWARRPLG
jgi:hypothetical protein